MSREVVERLLMSGVHPNDINTVYEMGRKDMVELQYGIKGICPKEVNMAVNCHQHGLNYADECPHCAAEEVVTELCRASDILAQAAAEMKDRGATYDQPEGERSMGKTVAAFAAVTGVQMSEQQGWQFMELLKMVRSNQGGYRADSFVDGAAYASLAGEAAAKGKGA